MSDGKALEKLLGRFLERFDDPSALERSDWSQFDPARDLVSLRALLARLEDAERVTALHRRCSKRLFELGARVGCQYGHEEPLVVAALSHDGGISPLGTG